MSWLVEQQCLLLGVARLPGWSGCLVGSASVARLRLALGCLVGPAPGLAAFLFEVSCWASVVAEDLWKAAPRSISVICDACVDFRLSLAW